MRPWWQHARPLRLSLDRQPAASILRIIQDAGAEEDVLVEAFWRAYRGRARFDPSRSFGAWMRRIATNVALDYLKAVHRRTGWSTTDDKVLATTDPDSGLRENIALAFHSLPPKLQVVASLAFIEEQPYMLANQETQVRKEDAGNEAIPGLNF